MFNRFRGNRRPSEEKATQQFDARLEGAKPLLFNLAGQLVNAYPEHQWNVLVGDDTSGRLPTRFIRKVFEAAGVRIPTGYIAASRSVNGGKPIETYTNHAERLASKSGTDPARVLLVTESAGDTLGSIRFTRDLIEPYAASVDTAIVASRGTPGEDLGDVYTAAVGDEGALDVVWKTFEHPLQTRGDEQWSGALTNLHKNLDPESAVAGVTSETGYRHLANHAYSRMDELAAEFWESQGGAMPPLQHPAPPEHPSQYGRAA
ncbi:MAG TPA: hypothetical protein VLF62_02635 [Candidatus Saccharimonadales bacterium]|nr:hypothetical protein [Candidatus Saccharimonadales bacterium]